MSRQDIKRLKSRDPEERKNAIRTVALAKDRNALKQLAVMAGDDPSKEIRKLARQAGVYIRRELGELESSNGDKPKTIPVDDALKVKAQRALAAAQTYYDSGERSKTIAVLVKALELDPNLRGDSYFISLCENATGGEGAAAVDLLNDRERHSTLAKKEAQAKKQEAGQAHIDELNTATWRDVGLDFAMLAAVSLVGTIIVLFLVVQSAQSFQNSYDANREAVDEALAEFYAAGRQSSRILWQDEFGATGLREHIEVIYESDPAAADPTGPPVKSFTVMQPDEDFMATVEDWQEAGIARIVTPGFVVSLSLVVLMFLFALLVHLIAGVFFRGKGRLVYFMDKSISLIGNRTVILLILLLVTIVLGFSGGGNITPFLAIIAVFGVTVLLKLIGIITSTYRLAFPLALVALLAGLAPFVAAGFGIMTVGIL